MLIAEEQLAKEDSEGWRSKRNLELERSRFKPWLHHLTPVMVLILLRLNFLVCKMEVSIIYCEN